MKTSRFSKSARMERCRNCLQCKPKAAVFHDFCIDCQKPIKKDKKNKKKALT